jgi:hypothetical protein
MTDLSSFQTCSVDMGWGVLKGCSLEMRVASQEFGGMLSHMTSEEIYFHGSGMRARDPTSHSGPRPRNTYNPRISFFKWANWPRLNNAGHI